MEKKGLLVYHIQRQSNFFYPSRKQENKLINDNIPENINFIKSEDICFEDLELCYKIIDKCDIILISDYGSFISEHLILQCNYAIKKKIPVYTIRYHHKLKFKIVKLAMLLPKQNFGGLILKQSGAKSKLF
jgi:hypothetical protein